MVKPSLPMNADIGPRDETLVALLGDVHTHLDLQDFRPALLQALARAVPVDQVSLNSLGSAPGEAVSLSAPAIPANIAERFARHAHEHPLIVELERSSDSGPRRISDVIDRRAFRALPIYRDVYRELGLAHEVAFALGGPGGHLVVALSRRRKDFTDAECALLERARPHLVRAYRNAVAYTSLLTRLAEAPIEPPADLFGYGLTPRETEIVRRVASGHSNREIADQLGVTTRTLYKHLEHAYRKMGVHSRSDAARVAWSDHVGPL